MVVADGADASALCWGGGGGGEVRSRDPGGERNPNGEINAANVVPTLIVTNHVNDYRSA